uniref:Selenium binding family protein n=1 Tax=Rhizophora mucronata TaxID=61149 RepID=A0A2P2KDL0_RHIMU
MIGFCTLSTGFMEISDSTTLRTLQILYWQAKFGLGD